jgi:hypothetical protein
MMSYHTSATTAATFSLGTIENRSGGWCNRWNTVQNRKGPDDGPLDKILIPTKNDDRYTFGTPQTPHIFATIDNNVVCHSLHLCRSLQQQRSIILIIIATYTT